MAALIGRVIKAWPTLSRPIKAAILAAIRDGEKQAKLLLRTP